MESGNAADAPTTLLDELRGLVGPGSRDLWLIYLATFLEYLGIFSFLQTLPLWLSDDFGMSDKAAAWWASLFSLLVTLLSFFAGALTDTFGVRRLLVVSFAVTAATRLGMSLAGTGGEAVAWTMAFAFAYALTSPALQVAVNLAARPATRAFAFTIWYVSFNLAGAVIGWPIDAIRRQFLEGVGEARTLVARSIDLPLLGIHEVSAHDVILACGFISAALAALVVCFVRRDLGRDATPGGAASANPLRAVRAVVSAPAFWRFMLLMVLLSLVRLMFQHMHFTWPKYVTRVEGDAFPVGTVWSLNSLGILFLAPLATALTRRLPIFPVLLVGATISAASPFLLCLGSGLPIQVAMIAVLTVGEALWSPRLYEYNVAIAPRGQEATYVGLAKLPFFLAKLLVTPMSGWLLTSYCPAEGARDPGLLWAIVGASTLAGPLGMWLLQGWIREKREAAA
ncbi:MAG: MFS transporter [Planctomycetaceae bacterium]